MAELTKKNSTYTMDFEQHFVEGNPDIWLMIARKLDEKCEFDLLFDSEDFVLFYNKQIPKKVEIYIRGYYHALLDAGYGT